MIKDEQKNKGQNDKKFKMKIVDNRELQGNSKDSDDSDDGEDIIDDE